MTSSGSVASAKGVKPRKSQKTTTISAPVAGEHGLVVDHQVGQLRRQEAPQPTDALELGHLVLHPLLELAVPRGDLVGLPLDGVVVALEPGQRPHPRQQLALVEGLGDEVVRAGLQPLQPLRGARRR